MTRIANEQARTDPEALERARTDTLTNAEAIEAMTDLASQIDRQLELLQPIGAGRWDQFADIRIAVWQLHAALTRHEGLRESAENLTYLGNIAAFSNPNFDDQ